MDVVIGYSELPDSVSAGIHAAKEALSRTKRQDRCSLALLFCTARHNQQLLRGAICSVLGQSIPIWGGGAVGVITNDTYGYAGDQVGLACIWLDDADCQIIHEPGLLEGEEETGARLGQRLCDAGIAPDSSVMIFYDAVDATPEGVRLLMATHILAGIERGLGFLPNLTGAGMQGDHICTPVAQFLGDGIGDHSVIALSFSQEICMDTAVMHGCHPASPYYTVTKAEGPVILEINHTPALSFLGELFDGALKPEDYPFFLLFGIDHGKKWSAYDENNYASRLCLSIDKARGGIVMFEPDMVEGTEFQIMYRTLDPDYMKPKLEALFDRLDDREPLFALYINCAGRCAGYGGVDIEDALVLQQAVAGRVPLLGLYTGVEIAPVGGKSRGLDWTGVFCLFSRRKPGKISAVSTGLTWGGEKSPASETASLDAALALCAQNTAKILSMDAQSIAIRHDLEQKRRGFQLLSSLMTFPNQSTDYIETFHSVARRINAALNMQKTVVLVPDSTGQFAPAILQGYPPQEQEQLTALRLRLPEQLLDCEVPVLVTGAEEESYLQEIRQALRLPYFVAVPVVVNCHVAAILLTGRMAEQPPFLSRLSCGDVETMQAVAGLISSVLIRRQLHDVEERTRIMLDSTPICANFWNREFRNIDCNLEAVKLFDMKQKQEYLDRFSELSPEFQPNGRRSMEMAREKIVQAFEEGCCVFDWMHQKLNGESIPAKITLVRVQYRNEDVVVGYTQDLRELKTQMAEIEKKQEELRLARDRAEESSRAKSSFLANMSHEIRTPMNAIIGMTEIARGTQDPERIQYCLDKISKASSHLLNVINDVLDMSKIEAGKFTISPSEFALDDLLERVVSAVNFLIDEKQQTFFIDLDQELPSYIISDKQRLIQVMSNLLTNATKFTPESGKITLSIHKLEEQSDQCTLLVQVRDTGIGISEEQQKKLFQPFVQADGSISRQFDGNGLGLAICRGIVEQMGGKIWIESALGAGSNFQFTVTVQKSGRIPLAPSLKSDLKGLKLLVVDDMPEVLEYFEAFSIRNSMIFRGASSAEQACQILDEDSNFHVIFVDWSMPDTNGIELTRMIRQRYGEHVVVVMISAFSWTQLEEEANAAGVNRFLAKPLLLSPLVDCINECLTPHQPMAEPKADEPDSFAGCFQDKHILLAEDIEINREILFSLLEETGVVFDFAENGRIACELFKQNPHRYDMILMDIHMPEMDGYQATRNIRAMQIPKATEIPIVAMTANVFREDVENCMAAGMNAHVGKPLDIDEVFSVLSRYLG